MGFFLRQSSDTHRWASSTLNAVYDLAHKDVVEEVGGIFWYYCYILTDFDPIRAKKLYNNCSMEEVSKAMLAKKNYNRPIED